MGTLMAPLTAAMNKGHLDTCKWLLSRQEYKDWAKSGTESEIHWIHGRPGSSKFKLGVLDTGADLNLISKAVARERDSPPKKSRSGIRPSERGSLKAIWRPEAHGVINSVPVTALVDSGSCVSALSEQFATQHAISYDQSITCEIRLPSGSMIRTVGTAMVDFRFSGEHETYRRPFHVLRRSLYDVILGKPFLDSTRTLTNFTKRITQALTPCLLSGNRLFLIGESHNKISCAVNGRYGSAIADTGSELMIVSGAFARMHGFRVKRGQRHRRLISFIDGSTALTDGMVRAAKLKVDLPELPYGAELDYNVYVNQLLDLPGYPGSDRRSKFIYDLHVLEDLPCDIILSNEFIHEHNVFLRQSLLEETSPRVQEDPGSLERTYEPGLCVITDGRNIVNNMRRRILGRSRDHPPKSRRLTAWDFWEDKKRDEIDRHASEVERIDALPSKEQAPAREAEERKRDTWASVNRAPSVAETSTTRAAQASSSFSHTGGNTRTDSLPQPPDAGTHLSTSSPISSRRPGGTATTVPSSGGPNVASAASPQTITAPILPAITIANQPCPSLPHAPSTSAQIPDLNIAHTTTGIPPTIASVTPIASGSPTPD